MKTHAARLLESSAPAFERRERLAGQLSLHLLAPMLPRTPDRVCARRLAVHPAPLSTHDLLLACNTSDTSKLAATQLKGLLQRHPAFTPAGPGSWQLGELGLPVIDAHSAGRRVQPG